VQGGSFRIRRLAEFDAQTWFELRASRGHEQEARGLALLQEAQGNSARD
jgi:hypothetical protein